MTHAYDRQYAWKTTSNRSLTKSTMRGNNVENKTSGTRSTTFQMRDERNKHEIDKHDEKKEYKHVSEEPKKNYKR
eukprot:6249996-Amphidinium_carterae.1